MKKLFLLLAVIVSMAVAAQAQTQTIHGTVHSAVDDEPLVGASVQPLGGGNGTSTDIDGNFTLRIPASVKEIKVTYVGMKEVVVPVSANMRVILESSSNMLDNVVVTGYGTGKKLGTVVGSVAVVGENTFADSPSSNFVDALQGQVAGLNIASSSGEPMSTPSMHPIHLFIYWMAHPSTLESSILSALTTLRVCQCSRTLRQWPFTVAVPLTVLS